MTFQKIGVGQQLADALSKQGITEPTDIQRESIPRILEGKNLIGRAPTGTGKTLAYLLPAIMGLTAESDKVQALVLAPTYELCVQIGDAAKQLVADAGLELRVQTIIGGANISRQIDKLKTKPQLVVGSPGRIIELQRKGKLKLDCVHLLVLDEFDRLLDDQNIKNSVDVVKLLPRQKLQYLMFSATAARKALERASFLDSPEFVHIEETRELSVKRANLYAITPFREKADMVRRLARRFNVKRGLVFINRTFDAGRTLEKLCYEGIKAEALLGNVDKQKRQKAIADFKSGRLQLLLSTDLAARGLDIPEIDFVFNMDMPETAQTYLHRAGRTARAGNSGTVITLADEKEAYKLMQLEKSLGIELQDINGNRRHTSGNKLAHSHRPKGPKTEEEKPRRPRKPVVKEHKSFSEWHANQESRAKQEKPAKREGYAKREGFAKSEGFAAKSYNAEKAPDHRHNDNGAGKSREHGAGKPANHNSRPFSGKRTGGFKKGHSISGK